MDYQKMSKAREGAWSRAGGGPSGKGTRGRGRSRLGTSAPCCPRMSSLSEYALRMTRLSARLFGEVARPTDSKSMKVVKLFSEQPLAKRKETYDWYPNHNTYFALMGTLRFFGLYRDEHQDFKDEQMRLKKLRGKGKPRKGEGKRATKKK
ncbi:28S ribosomal protein S33, mitochondrial [Manis javanica]|nr:28S ribosomal protein S33, mitochondrial [Manis javanica]